LLIEDLLRVFFGVVKQHCVGYKATVFAAQSTAILSTHVTPSDAHQRASHTSHVCITSPEREHGLLTPRRRRCVAAAALPPPPPPPRCTWRQVASMVAAVPGVQHVFTPRELDDWYAKQASTLSYAVAFFPPGVLHRRRAPAASEISLTSSSAAVH
jgi:hypothetical protein